MVRKSRPWAAYGLRLLCSGLLFATGHMLLAGSTFALRMRNDMPVELITLALAAALSFLPLLFGRHYLGAALVGAFLMSGIGAYWWTTIAWDEFFKDSGFPAKTPPALMDYMLVASAPAICAFYAIASRASVLRADLRNRGADRDEAARAACASFLAGSMLFVLTTALAAGLWVLMATGVVFTATAPLPTGVPALVLTAALCVVAYALIARRLPRPSLARFRGAPPAPPVAAGAPEVAKRSWLARRRTKKASS